MNVRDLKTFIEPLPDEMVVEYVELGFDTSYGRGPMIWEFKVVDGKLLLPVNSQEYPE